MRLLGAARAGLLPKGGGPGTQETPSWQRRGLAGHESSEASRTDPEIVARSNQESGPQGSSTGMGQVSRQARKPTCRSGLRTGLTIIGGSTDTRQV